MADNTTALVPFEGFKNELVARQDEIAALLPSTITKEAFINTAIVAVKTNPDLLACDRRSLHKAVTLAAHDGMKPDGKEGAILVQNEKVTVDGKETWIKAARWAPMAYGMRKRFRELDGVVVDTAVVHENDRFVWVQGDEARIEHFPAPLGTDRGKPVGAYAIFKKGGGVLAREVMNLAEIEAVRAISKQPNGLMWGKFWSEAARKSVLRRGAKSVPVSDAMRAVIERDHEEFEVHDITPPAPQLAKPVRGPAVMVVWNGGDAPEHVAVGEFGKRALVFIHEAEPAAVLAWAERNRLALREFWGVQKDEALAIKAAIEQASARQEPKPEPLVEEPPPPEGPPDDDGQAAMAFAEAAAEPDDSEIVLRDLLTEIGRERDPKKRAAIWADNAKAREAMTDAQVARLKAALDQMEMAAGKRGKAA